MAFKLEFSGGMGGCQLRKEKKEFWSEEIVSSKSYSLASHYTFIHFYSKYLNRYGMSNTAVGPRSSRLRTLET